MTAGRPQRPGHQNRLEEQSNESLGVGVEAERVGLLDELGDVAREDHYEESGCGYASERPPPPAEDERQPEQDLDDSRREYDGIFVDGKPVGYLRSKLLTLHGEVGNPGSGEHQAERVSGECLTATAARAQLVAGTRN